MSYFNHKWKSFLNESRKEDSKKLNERRTKRSIQSDTSKSAGQKTLILPKLRISDEWGKPSGESPDRDLIEVFFGALPKGNIQTKIAHIENFIKNCESQVCGDRRDSSEILSNLMVLDALSTIIYSFNEKVGGYIFESFVAALLGGSAQAVPATSGEGIQDIITDTGEKVSLKLVTGKVKGDAGVPGSMKNLRGSLLKEEYGMPYLVAVKIKSDNNDIAKIVFYEFDIGTNGKQIINEDGTEQLPRQKKSKPRPGIPLIFAEDYIVPKKQVGGRDRTRIYLANNTAARWNVPTTSVGKKGKVYELNLGNRERMKEVADSYAEQLNNDVLSIFSNLDEYVRNINKYLVRQDTSAGATAINNAKQLKKGTQDIQKKIK